MDVMGGVRLAGGGELKVVTGIDDHSRFCVCAHLTPRATARPVCEAFLAAMRRHGAPEQVLTDNGKVFTARFGRGKGLVLFDRLCHENGIRHLLTAPRSPTTTGKVERFHKTVRSEFLQGRVFASLEEAQAALDAWVEHYNAERPHQGIGMTPPLRRFELAAAAPEPVAPLEGASEDEPPELRPLTRLVSANGTISFEATRYHAGAWLAGEAVELTPARRPRRDRPPRRARRLPRAPPRRQSQDAGADRPAAAPAARRAAARLGPGGEAQGRPHRLRELRWARLLRQQPPARRAGRGAARRRYGADLAARRSSSRRTPRGTTERRNTAPSRRLRDDRTAATPHGSQGKKVERIYRSQCVTRVVGLDTTHMCGSGCVVLDVWFWMCGSGCVVLDVGRGGRAWPTWRRGVDSTHADGSPRGRLL